MSELFFFGFAALLLTSAVLVIASRNAVTSALSLVLAFVASSALWILIEAEFLGLALVVIYVGAVMVLFMFVVMMLDLNRAALFERVSRFLPLGIVAGSVFVLQLVWVLVRYSPQLELPGLVRHDAGYRNLFELGMLMYTDYLLAVEMAGVLLLVAMVAAIALAYNGPKKRQFQSPGEQAKVQARDRVRLVSLPRHRA